MIIFFFVILTILPFHFQNLGTTKTYREEYKDPMFPLSLLVNTVQYLAVVLDLGDLIWFHVKTINER